MLVDHARSSSRVSIVIQRYCDSIDVHNRGSSLVHCVHSSEIHRNHQNSIQSFLQSDPHPHPHPHPYHHHPHHHQHHLHHRTNPGIETNAACNEGPRLTEVSRLEASYQSSATSSCLPDSTSSEYPTLHTSRDTYQHQHQHQHQHHQHHHESTFSSASPSSSCASSLIITKSSSSSLGQGSRSVDDEDDDYIQSNNNSVHYDVPSTKSLSSSLTSSLVSASSSSSSSSSSSFSSSSSLSPTTLSLKRKDESNVHSYRRFRKKRGAGHQIHQRQAANLRERQRMQSINDAFECLRDALPKDPPYEKRSSKVETLKLAIQYIEKLNEYLSTGRNPNDPSQSPQPTQVEKIIIPCKKVFHGLNLAGHSLSWTQSEPKRSYVMVAKIWTPEDPRSFEGEKGDINMTTTLTTLTSDTTDLGTNSTPIDNNNCYQSMDQSRN